MGVVAFGGLDAGVADTVRDRRGRRPRIMQGRYMEVSGAVQLERCDPGFDAESFPYL